MTFLMVSMVFQGAPQKVVDSDEADTSAKREPRITNKVRISPMPHAEDLLTAAEYESLQKASDLTAAQDWATAVVVASFFLPVKNIIISLQKPAYFSLFVRWWMKTDICIERPRTLFVCPTYRHQPNQRSQAKGFGLLCLFPLPEFRFSTTSDV